ncbi:hypothetical protein [Deinococcus alpinitundrae]|uniref:hypothetical protein n=1 Tax=Deinococcus alpinitundrae TaxID=468913 RepID=UPI00137AAC7E|nr:hypothetical protein [Deinococcus alpinitundrae]
MMTIPEQLERALADLAALESDNATLEANAAAQDSALIATRRESRSGTATFEAVVKAQTRTQAARGLLDQHRQDVADARALLEELEAAALSLDLLAEGRAAFQMMREVKEAHNVIAVQTDAAVRRGVRELAALEDSYAQAHSRLRAALILNVESLHGVNPYISTRLTYVPSPERLSGQAFLREIDPELSEPSALSLKPLNRPANLAHVSENA